MRILIIGGYGSFGRRLSENLLRYHSHHLIVAGRSIEKAKQFQREAKLLFNKYIDIAESDVENSNLEQVLRSIKPAIVVNTSGPYQYQRDGFSGTSENKNYAVARACIAVGSHYIDLADDRQFVTQFSHVLNAEAKTAQVCLVSGASTVPGLSGAVIDHLQSEFNSLTKIYFGISPGNRFNKGKATVASILSYTGRPFSLLKDGITKLIYGWQGLRRYDFGSPIGRRWMANCQIPDLDLLPKRYPSVDTVHFQAGLELRFMHFTMWLLAALVRINIIPKPEKLAGLLCSTSSWFDSWGTDKGGMFVQLQGRDGNGREKTIDWQLIAEKGEGPNIPVIAAELVINKLTTRQLGAGAYPCLGLFTLTEFLQVAKRWNIYTRVRSTDRVITDSNSAQEKIREQTTA